MATLLFITFAVLLLLGMPVAFSIALSALTVLLAGGVKPLMVVQRMFTAQDSFSLIAVPFFILAGDLMSKGTVSKVLVEGSGAATTAAVGATLIPEMEKRGYRVDKSAALIASAGTIGVVIPPSVPMVLYAVIAEQSVSTMFRNGFVPGILMGLVLIVIALVEAKKLNYPMGTKLSGRTIAKTFVKAIWGILMPLIILGGIFSGYFTSSEAADIAVIYAIIIGFFVYRDLGAKKLYEIVKGSAKTSAVIMIIIACSGAFGWVLANWNIPETIANGVLSVSQNKYIIMFIIGVIILVAGIFMETSSAIILLTPVFLPLVKAMGVNLVHFGVVFTVGLAIGMITPPVAINLFVASSITKMPMMKIGKAIRPYLLGRCSFRG